MSFAMAILHRYPHALSESRCLLATSLTSFYLGRLTESEQLMKRARKAAVANGEMLYAGYTTFILACFQSFHLSGSEMNEELDRAIAFMNQHSANDPISRFHLHGQKLALEALTDPTRLDSGDLTAVESEFLIKAEPFPHLARTGFLVARARSAYILNQPEFALKLLARVKDNALMPLPDLATLVIVRLMATMAVIRARWESESDASDWADARESLWSRARADLRTLQLWATSAPQTFLSPLYLAEAEWEFTIVIERMAQRDEAGNFLIDEVEESEVSHMAAMYRRAMMSHIDHHQQPTPTRKYRLERKSSPLTSVSSVLARGAGQNLWLSACCFERFGEYWLKFGMFEVSMGLLIGAFGAWQRYGAVSKVKQMMRMYGDRFDLLFGVFGSKPSASSIRCEIDKRFFLQ